MLPYVLTRLLFFLRRVEDEAVLDRGASFVKHVCDEEEVEGKISDEYQHIIWQLTRHKL